MGASRDLPDDPGLAPSSLATERGPYVGSPAHRPLRRFARSPRLDELLRELQRGFGPQHWWPARTPFEVIVGAVLTQNTAWRNAELALASLAERDALRPARLVDASPEELERWIRSSGTYRAKARKLRELSSWYLEAGGLRSLRERPLGPLRAELCGVWGIGPETADSILCYAAGRPTPVVDVYARRVLGRHGLVDPSRSYEELHAWLSAELLPEPAVHEEFHALCVRAGHGHCKPTARCEDCPATTPAPYPTARPTARPAARPAELDEGARRDDPGRE